MPKKIVVYVSDSFIHNVQSRDEVEFLDSLFGELEDMGFEVVSEDSLDITDDDEEFDEDADGNGETFPDAAEAQYDKKLYVKAKVLVARYQRETPEKIYIVVEDDADQPDLTHIIKYYSDKYGPAAEAARRTKKS